MLLQRASCRKWKKISDPTEFKKKIKYTETNRNNKNTRTLTCVNRTKIRVSYYNMRNKFPKRVVECEKRPNRKQTLSTRNDIPIEVLCIIKISK